jgi:hypothetical protein
MKIALIVISVFIIVFGIWAGPCHRVIQTPPDSSLLNLRREIENLPIEADEVESLRSMIAEGITRNRNERARLSNHLDTVALMSIGLGLTGMTSAFVISSCYKRKGITEAKRSDETAD